MANLPKLQLALDTLDLHLSSRATKKSAPYLDVIEVGTILCLAEGMRAVRTIRSLFPEKTVLADVRIAEAGGLAKMAFDSGADWVSVVSGATLNTIEAVVAEAQKHGGDVQIELFSGWTEENARQWRELGVRQVITHRSRDLEAEKGELTWSSRDFDEIRSLTDMGFQVDLSLAAFYVEGHSVLPAYRSLSLSSAVAFTRPTNLASRLSHSGRVIDSTFRR